MLIKKIKLLLCCYVSNIDLSSMYFRLCSVVCNVSLCISLLTA